MNQDNQVRLNIGTGQTYIPEFTNISHSSQADLQLELGKDKLPFEDNSVDFIFSYHALEHSSDYLFALSEIHRILKHGSLFLLGLPYVTLTKYHLVNPYHLHNFNEYSFDFFDPQKTLNGDKNNKIFFEKSFHRFHYIGAFNLLPPPFRSWCREHLFNVVRKIDYGLIAIKEPNVKISSYDPQTMIYKFDQCLDACRAYHSTINN
ncbi:MAG: class I SAM-dependent methyltransferase [Okeania sp. SIO3B5]|uniref:methyltransferase domain-containing protein n=1 Tax=Okeania sp. SIO3B5 TaxID=2607811 RepID=UPI0014014610|nr:class I SAM-dependent methyltransferase [Okeania sp. SIO3B5]NEO58065.1 class I SAM-dependent methyltransferase [Okeania sp. SIO3B5]